MEEIETQAVMSVHLESVIRSQNLYKKYTNSQVLCQVGRVTVTVFYESTPSQIFSEQPRPAGVAQPT